MCGAETDDTTCVKVEGAELRVCDACSEHGTTISSGSDEAEEATAKYSTGDGGSSETADGSADDSTSDSRETVDPFDGSDELAPDYDERIREAREERGMSRAELADALNEKQSRLRKLERGETLPDEGFQQRIECHLDIDLSGGVTRGERESG